MRAESIMSYVCVYTLLFTSDKAVCMDLLSILNMVSY